MSSAETRSRLTMSIPPPPPFAPPSLPNMGNVLTTYTRTRSVSPAPFLVSHDTFIKRVASNNNTYVKAVPSDPVILPNGSGGENQEKLENNESSTISKKDNSFDSAGDKKTMDNKMSNTKEEKECSDLCVKNMRGKGEEKIPDSKVEDQTVIKPKQKKTKKKDGALSCQPVFIIEPPTPSIVKSQIPFNGEKIKSETESVSHDSFEKEKFPNQEQKQIEHKLKRRPSKKINLLNTRNNQETPEEKEKINIISNESEIISKSELEVLKQCENLTKKEIIVMTEVLNSRKSRSRSSSRMEEDILPIDVNKNESVLHKSDANDSVGSEATEENKLSELSESNNSVPIHSKYKVLKENITETKGPSDKKDSVNGNYENDNQEKQEIIDKMPSKIDGSIDITINLKPNDQNIIKGKEEKNKQEQEPNKSEKKVVYDPFEDMENIADLTVEKLKEQFLKEEMIENDIEPKFEFSAQIIEEETNGLKSFSEGTLVSDVQSKDAKEKREKAEVKIELHENNGAFTTPISKPSNEIERQKIETEKNDKKLQLEHVKKEKKQDVSLQEHTKYPNMDAKVSELDPESTFEESSEAELTTTELDFMIPPQAKTSTQKEARAAVEECVEAELTTTEPVVVDSVQDGYSTYSKQNAQDTTLPPAGASIQGCRNTSLHSQEASPVASQIGLQENRSTFSNPILKASNEIEIQQINLDRNGAQPEHVKKKKKQLLSLQEHTEYPNMDAKVTGKEKAYLRQADVNVGKLSKEQKLTEKIPSEGSPRMFLWLLLVLAILLMYLGVQMGFTEVDLVITTDTLQLSSTGIGKVDREHGFEKEVISEHLYDYFDVRKWP